MCSFKDWAKGPCALKTYSDVKGFGNFTRMSAVEGQSVVNVPGPVSDKKSAAMRNAIKNTISVDINSSLMAILYFQSVFIAVRSVCCAYQCP